MFSRDAEPSPPGAAERAATPPPNHIDHTSMNHRTTHLACCLALALLCPAATRADITYTRITEDDHDWTVIRMTVTPAPEPVPALRQRLLVREIDLKPGNTVPYYYRAFLQLESSFPRVRREFGEDEFDSWYATIDSTPLDRLPLEKVREAESRLGWIVEQYVAPATTIRDTDWQLGIESMRGVDVLSFLLPEFQESRTLARLLTIRTRLALAEGRHDDAIRTMQMTYRLSIDTARMPLFVCGLIGIANAGMAGDTMLELIAQADSPNMYWALAELPEPLIDLRAAARFEFDFGPRMFPFIHNTETTDRAPQEWNRLYTQSLRDLSTLADQPLVPRDEVMGKFAATGLALVGYPHAKSRLIEEGMSPERVERMAVGQVIAIYTERTSRRVADEFEKLWYMPFWEMLERSAAARQTEREARPLGGGEDRELLPIVSVLLPPVQAARTAQVRLERDLAAMRVIEAMRMHAAEHDGQLPESLDDIDLVPVPLNPATGQPFVYRLDGQTAVLELPPSDRIPGYNRRFEIQIATKNQ